MQEHAHDNAHDIDHRLEVDQYFEQIVTLLAQLYAYNDSCVGISRDEMDDERLKCVADTVTELFNTQNAEPDTDCEWLSEDVIAAMNSLEKSVQEILDEFGIVKASVERFKAIQHSDPEKYARLLEVMGVDSVMLHSHVEFRIENNAAGTRSPRKFYLHSPFLEPLEVFEGVTRFSKVSDEQIASLRRGVHTVLGWQVETEGADDSEKKLHKKPS